MSASAIPRRKKVGPGSHGREGPAASITLTYRIPKARRRKFLKFLEEAFLIYEEPGGICVSLFESLDHPGLFHEVVEYATLAAYERDQERVEKDPLMRETLRRFQVFVAGGKVEVRRLKHLRVPRRDP